MERRGCGLGCVIASLGLLLSCCLLPYLISSIYSLITALLQVSATPDWLWGDLITRLPLVGESDALYMFLAEGPICCVGAIGLLILILGLVMMISGVGPKEEEAYYAEEEDGYYAEPGFAQVSREGIEPPTR